MKKEKKKGIEFSVEWFAFQKFNSSRNFWKLSGKILYLFESFGWMYGKRPLSTDHVCLYSCHKPPPRKLFQGAFKTILYPEEAMNASHKSRLKENVPINHLFHFLFYFILVNDTDVLKTAQCASCTLSAFQAPTPFL